MNLSTKLFISLTITLSFHVVQIAFANWEEIGGSPRPWVGRGNDIAVGTYGQDDVIYIADNYYRLYKSTNQGDLWDNASDEDQQQTWQPNAVECQPSNANVAFIVKYPQFNYVWRTDDGGANWERFGHNGDHLINSRGLAFQVHPTQNCWLFMGTDSLYTQEGGRESTLWRRMGCEYGDHWKGWPTDFDPLTDGSFAWKPIFEFALGTASDTSLMYLAVGKWPGSDDSWGVYGTDNAWSAYFNEGNVDKLLDGIDCRSIAIDTERPDTLYAAAWNTTNGGLWVTYEGLQSEEEDWSQLSEAPDSIYDIVVVPNTSGQTIFVATKTDGIYKSTNAGQNWSPHSSGLKCKDIFSLDIDGNSILYAGGKWSVYKILSSGTSWTECTKGMRVPLVNGLMVDFPNIYCASDFDFIHFSTDAGDTWNTQYSFDSDTLFDNDVKTILPFDVERDGTASRLLYTAANDPHDSKADIIQKSTDNGISWTDSYVPNDNSSGKRCNDIVINQDSPSTAYVAYDYSSSQPVMLKTTNSGGSWSPINNDLPDDDVLDIGLYSGILGDILYVTTKGNGVYQSSNGGANWIAKGLSGETLNDIAINPTSSVTVYAAASDGVWKTTDSGNNWNQMTNGTSGKEIIELEIHPEHTSIIFAVAKDENGHYVYVSLDAGDDWVDKSSGLPDEFIPYFDPSTPVRPYVPLSIDPDYPDTLYMGTSNGIMKYPFTVGCGSITSNTTWGPDPVFVACDVKVEDGVTLTISEGTKIFIASDYDGSNIGDDPDKVEIIVEGNLIASGEESYPIVMISSDVNPSAGDWFGIRAESGSVDSLIYCIIKHASFGVKANNPSALIVEYCTIEDNYKAGIYMTNPPSTTKIRYSRIQDSGMYGIYASGDSFLAEEDTIAGNRYGIRYIGSSSPSINTCVITYPSSPVSSYYGIYVKGTDSSPVIQADSIYGFDQGGIRFSNVSSGGIITNTRVVSCGTYGIKYEFSSAEINGGENTKNLLKYNIYGLHMSGSGSPKVRRTKFWYNSSKGAYVGSGCFPDFGTSSDKGENSFRNIGGIGFYDLYNANITSISAIYNYWGEVPPNSREIFNAIYDPYLDEDPLPRIAPGLESANLPEDFELAKAYPNPFNPTVVISFSLSSPQFVTVKIFNILGQEVTTVFEGFKPAGETTITWDGKNYNGEKVVTGVYFCQLRTAEKQKILKMTVLK